MYVVRLTEPVMSQRFALEVHLSVQQIRLNQMGLDALMAITAQVVILVQVGYAGQAAIVLLRHATQLEPHVIQASAVNMILQ